MDTNLKGLNIEISANATPAIDALKNIGKASLEANKDIGTLSTTISDVNKKLSTLKKIVGGFGNKDLLNFNDSKQTLGKMLSDMKSLKTTAKGVGTALNSSLLSAEKTLKRIDRLLSKKHEFILSSSGADRTIDKISNVYDKINRVNDDTLALLALRADADKSHLTYARAVLNIEQQISNMRKGRIFYATQELNIYKEIEGRILNATTKLHAAQRVNSMSTSGTFNSTTHQSGGSNTLNSNVKNQKITINNPSYQQGKAQGFALYNTGGALGALARASKDNEKALRDNTSKIVTLTAGYFVYHKMLQSLDRVSHDMKELQRNRARVDAWGLNSKEKQEFYEVVKMLRKQNMFLSKSGAISATLAGASSIGHWDQRVIKETIDQTVKAAQAQKIMGYNNAEVDDIVKNIYGVSEARQVTNDPSKVNSTTKLVNDIVSATNGKVSVADIETIMRNLGPAALTISDDGLRRLAALAEQIKVAGHGNSGGGAGAGVSSIGTQIKQMVMMGLGKPSAKGAKAMLGELGLLDSSAYKKALADPNKQLAYTLLGLTQQEYLDDPSKIGLNPKEFQRGTHGQILNPFVLKERNDLARSGFFTKDLLQTDPVKWVETTIPVVLRYIASKDKREDFFGSETTKGKENLSQEKFLAQLTDEQVTGAINTFWAKTGLSQRILSILSTLSSTGYIHRSNEMYGTTLKQRDVTGDMIKRYDLDPSMLRLQTAITNLIQSFDDVAKGVGFCIQAVAQFIDQLSNWATKWKQLATMTGAWLIVKAVVAGITHTIHAYNMLDVVMQRHNTVLSHSINLERAKIASLERNINRQKFNGGDVGWFAQAELAIGKFKVSIFNVIGWFTKIATRAFSVVGWALLAVDIATIVGSWVSTIKVGTKTIGEYFDELISHITGKQTSAEMKAADVLKGDSEKGHLVTDAEDEIKKLQTEKEKLLEEQESIQKALSDKYENGSEEEYRLELETNKRLKEIDDRIRQINKDIGKQQDLVKEEIKLYETHKNEFIAQVKKTQEITKDPTYRNFILNYNELSQQYDDLNKKLAAATTDTDKENINKDIQKNKEEKNKLIENFKKTPTFEQIAKSSEELRKLSVAFFGKNIRALNLIEPEIKDLKEILLDIANATGIDTGVKKTGIVPSLIQLEDAKNPIADEAAKGTSESGSGFKKETSKNGKYLAKLRKETRKNSIMSKNGDGDLETYAETRQRMIEKLVDDINQGLIRNDDGSIPFLKNDVGQDLSTREVTLKDIDLDKTDNKGIKASDLVNAATVAERSKRFHTYVSSLKFEVEKQLQKSINDVFGSKKRTTLLGKYEGLSAEFEAFNRETLETIEKMTKMLPTNDPTWTKNIEEFKKSRAMLGFNDSLIKGNELLASNRTTTEDLNLKGMTTGEQLTYKYQQGNQEANAQVEQIKREIELRAEALEKAAKSADERVEIERKKNEEIQAINESHQKLMLAREEDYQRQLNRFGDLHLKQKVEDWQNFGKSLESLQDGIMDGFVKADIAWLDGDKKAWKKWGIDLLKMLRDMWLKQGIASVLGDITKSITGGLGKLLERDEKTGEGGGIPSIAKSIAGFFGGNKDGGSSGGSSGIFGGIGDFFGGIGKKVAGFFGFGGDSPAKTESIPISALFSKAPVTPSFLPGGNAVNPFSIGPNGSVVSNFTQFGANPMGVNPLATNSMFGNSFGAPQFGGNNLLNTGSNFGLSSQPIGNSLLGQGGGAGFGFGGATGGLNLGGDAGGAGGGLGDTFSALGSQVSEATDTFKNMTDVSTTLSDAISSGSDVTATLSTGMQTLETSTGAVNVVQQTTQTIETAGQAIKQTTNTTEATGNISLKIFSELLTKAATAVFEFITSLKAQQAASTVSSAFANGGIMTSKGSLPLKMYANGGIAKTAQVAIFGEGSKPEAYVPLPDGRSIPVSLNIEGGDVGKRDSMGNNYNISINVTNNSDGTSKSDTKNGDLSNPELKKIASRLKDIVQQEIANQSRPGGLLYNQR